MPAQLHEQCTTSAQIQAKVSLPCKHVGMLAVCSPKRDWCFLMSTVLMFMLPQCNSKQHAAHLALEVM